MNISFSPCGVLAALLLAGCSSSPSLPMPKGEWSELNQHDTSVNSPPLKTTGLPIKSVSPPPVTKSTTPISKPVADPVRTSTLEVASAKQTPSGPLQKTVVTTAPAKAFPSTPPPAPTIVNVIAADASAKPQPAPAPLNQISSSSKSTLSAAANSQSLSATKKAVQPIQVVKPLEAPWTITPGDVTLRRALAKWAARAGWQLVWEASVDVPINVTASFTGDFRTAVKSLFQSLSAADVNLTAFLYSGNRVLRVTESGRRAQ